MKTSEKAKELTQQLIEPLAPETKNLFRPVDLAEYDRLEIKLADNGKLDFVVRPFGKKKQFTKTKRFGLGEKQVEEVTEVNDKQLTFFTEQNDFDWVDCNSSWNARTWWRRLPESKENFNDGSCWLAGTDFNVLVINALWPYEQLVFSPDAETLYLYLLTRFLHQASKSADKGRFYLEGRIPTCNDFIDSPAFPLMPFQKVALLNSVGQEASALFMEQGTGKTPVAIARICNEASRCDHMYRVLVVCPKNVRQNWQSEFQKFASVAGKTAVLRGGKLTRIKILLEGMKKDKDCEWTAVIASYDVVERTWEAMKMIQWDLVILDESHYIKSSRTKRFKQMKLLRDRADARMCLTGTPVTNRGAMDLYSQLEFLGEGLSGFKSYEKFRLYYGRWEKRGRLQALVAYKNMPLIQERLARLSFQIDKKTALPELPEKVYDIYEVTMTKEQIRYYVELRDRLILEIEAEMEASENKVLTARNALVKLLRLAQITSGFITWDKEYEDEPRRVDRIDPNPKIEALVEILNEKGPNDKTIIWACWIQDIKTIAARLKAEGIDCVTFHGGTSDKDREIAIERFNKDPNCKVFVGNPAAGGVGLNLLGYDYTVQSPNANGPNANHVIYFSQNWSMVARSQSEDRCHRKGTRMNVRYTDLCVVGTIDEEIRCRVLMYRRSANEVQDVKDILRRVIDNAPEANGD